MTDQKVNLLNYNYQQMRELLSSVGREALSSAADNTMDSSIRV